MSHHYIEFKNVTYQYPNGHKALDDVSFKVTHGEKVALLGLNGAGKSTLLLHTNGLLLPTEGMVDIGGIPVTKKTLKIVRQSVGLVFQNPDDQLFMPTVREDVAFGPINMGLPADAVEQRVEKALKDVGLEGLGDYAPFELSGGQRRAASIATILSMGPSIMVLDEPTANLDTNVRRRLLDLLSSFSHTILIATHDLDAAIELCPRSILLHKGKLMAFGDTREMLADKNLMEMAGMDIPPSVLQLLSTPSPV